MPVNLSNEDLDVIAYALKASVRKYLGSANAAKGLNSSCKNPKEEHAAALAQMNLFKDCLAKVDAERTKEGRIPPKHLTAVFDSVTVTF